MEIKGDQSCNPDTCQYHYLTESIIKDLKRAVEKLMEGQDQMRETVIQLTEAFKAMEKIDNKIGQIEVLQREKDKEQDCKIDELKAFMYKSMGVVAAIGILIGVLLKITGV